jgi:hypothetical protein
MAPGIALGIVSPVTTPAIIVDGVNGVAYGATSLWEHTIGLCAIHTCVWDPSAEPPEIWSRNKEFTL